MVGLHQWWVDGDGFMVTALTCYIAVVPNNIYQELIEWKLVVTGVVPIRKSGWVYGGRWWWWLDEIVVVWWFYGGRWGGGCWCRPWWCGGDVESGGGGL
ncbi:hypothetical protein Hdeb2414_s0003g00096051 [Helianthus debilis subsp. tardiflorus]